MGGARVWGPWTHFYFRISVISIYFCSVQFTVLPSSRWLQLKIKFYVAGRVAHRFPKFILMLSVWLLMLKTPDLTRVCTYNTISNARKAHGLCVVSSEPFWEMKPFVSLLMSHGLQQSHKIILLNKVAHLHYSHVSFTAKKIKRTKFYCMKKN